MTTMIGVGWADSPSIEAERARHLVRFAMLEPGADMRGLDLLRVASQMRHALHRLRETWPREERAGWGAHRPGAPRVSALFRCYLRARDHAAQHCESDWAEKAAAQTALEYAAAMRLTNFFQVNGQRFDDLEALYLRAIYFVSSQGATR